jgi:hypothetical protein
LGKCECLYILELPDSRLIRTFSRDLFQDPIVRFCTEYDALYPLVDDLGKDGFTLYATGPPRSLRPLTKALFQSWEGWPRFRENWKLTNQNFQSVGIQHLLLPEPLRYLNDRFVSANIGVPPTDSIVRIASRELLPALAVTFPMDVFQISYIPQAVRRYVLFRNWAIPSAKNTNTILLSAKLSTSLFPCIRFHYFQLCGEGGETNTSIREESEGRN